MERRLRVAGKPKSQYNVRLSEDDREFVRDLLYLSNAPSASDLFSAALSEYSHALLREMARRGPDGEVVNGSWRPGTKSEEFALLIRALSRKDGMSYRYDEKAARLEFEDDGWHPADALSVSWR